MWQKLFKIAAAVWLIIIFIKLPSYIWDAGLVMPWFTQKGLAFYKDFDGGAYFPLPRLLMIPINNIFSWNIRATVYLAYFQEFITAFFVYKISKKLISARAATVATIYYLVWFPFILRQNTFDISLLLGFVLLIMFSVKYRPSTVGFLASIGIFSQQMFIVPTLLFVLFLRSARKIAQFILGFLPVAFGVVLYFLINKNLYEFVDATVLYYLDKSRYPSFEFYFAPRDLTMLFFLSIPLLILTFIPKRGAEKTSLFVVIALTIASTMIAVFHPRRFLYFLPLLSFTAGLIFENFAKLKFWSKRISVALLLILGGYVITTMIPWYANTFRKPADRSLGLSQSGDYVYSAVSWIRQNTPPESKIQVFGPMLLYYEAQRLPANKRTYSALPWTYEPFEETKSLFSQKPADYWLVDERLFTRFINWGYPHQAEFIRGLLDTKYQKVQSSDWMSVYKLK